MGILAVALAVMLVGCSDDPESEPESEPGSSAQTDLVDPTDTSKDKETGTLDCPAFEETAQKIVDAQAQLYGQGAGSDPDAAIDDLLTELEGLKEGAPADIQDALTGLGDGFRRAADLLDDPSQDQTALLELATELSEDGQAVTTYIAKQCA
jgi:hypothetical protein